MPPYQKVIVYYFTGTGNSRNISIWISRVCEKYQIETRCVSIGEIHRLTVNDPPKDALIFFVSPIHGFNYPPVTLNFIRRFPRGHNPVVLMNTRAGMLIGNFITPGLTGIAFYLSSLILILKGYSIRGFIPADMPSNWISVHPGLNDRTIHYLHDKIDERITKHAEKVIQGNTNFIALREIIQDILISPIAAGYYFLGRFLFAKSYYASLRCNKCMVCIEKCPVKAIKLVHGRPFWTYSCESCMRCMGNCSQKAIETAHGFIIVLFILNAVVLVPLLNKVFVLSSITGEVWIFILKNLIFFSVLAILYRLVHYLLRFPFFNKMMIITSLTWYTWWGRRYKALKIKGTK